MKRVYTAVQLELIHQKVIFDLKMFSSFVGLFIFCVCVFRTQHQHICMLNSIEHEHAWWPLKFNETNQINKVGECSIRRELQR